MTRYLRKLSSNLKTREFSVDLEPGDSPILNTLLRRSRHANSTLDVQDDFDVRLRPIKRRDGGVSELFPISLRELFSYDGMQRCSVMDLARRINTTKAEKLVRLMKWHNLRPLGKPSENLNRFLIFIGKHPHARYKPKW